MSPPHRIASTLLVASVFALPVQGQAPPATTRAPVAPQARPAAPRRVTPTQTQTPAQQPLRRRSIVHHYPYPYPSFYYNDRTAGFRNPGGGGRYAEYYPPGDRFQADPGVDPVRVASFDRGGGPTLADQRAAQQIGIQRDNMIQQHIDNYARPYYGYGMGVGFFGGFN